MTEVWQACPLDVTDSPELRYLPEGPYPLSEARFSWVGIQHGPDATFGSINIFDLSEKVNRSFRLPGRPGFAFPCNTADTFVVGCERSLGFYNTATEKWEPFCDGIDADVDNTIINDGLPFEDNLIFGTKDLEFSTKKAGLYLWRGRDGKLIRLRDDQICSNGKAVTNGNGETFLIDIDSPTRQLMRYPLDIEAGQLGKPEVVLDLTGDSAVPDGMTLTPDGTGVIVSMFLPSAAEYGETRHYRLDSGELIGTWQTPASPQNTCPALVRFDGGLKLIITTAVENLSDADQRQCFNAGQIFIADVQFDGDESSLSPRFAR